MAKKITQKEAEFKIIKKCEEKNCGYPKLRDVSIKIIDSLIVEKKEQQKIWFKRNIHYVYYTFGVIAFIYAFIKWIYPFLIKNI